MSATPRTLTLEAQARSPRVPLGLTQRLFSSIAAPQGPQGSEDVVEQQVKAEISQHEDDERSSLVHLLRDYSRFKGKLSYNVLESIVQVWTFRQDLESDILRSSADNLQLSREGTFSAGFSVIAQCLVSPCPSGLRLLALSRNDGDTEEFKILTFTQMTIATLRGRLRSINRAPSNIIAVLCHALLRLPDDSIFALWFGGLPDVYNPTFRLPSMEIRQGNLDPELKKDNLVKLSWQSAIPKFSSDLDVSIWEHHKTLPKPSQAEVSWYPQYKEGEAFMVIVFRHNHSFRLFRVFRESEFGGPTSSSDVWSTYSEGFFSLSALFKVLIFETMEFLKSALQDLHNMRSLARQNPSSYKIRYLVHLDDCRSAAYDGVQHATSVMDSTLKWINDRNEQANIWCAEKSFEDRASEIRADLNFLCSELENIQVKIFNLKQEIHEHQALTHDRRNFALTLLAAIFLPLSFASTFFGMNMNTATSPSPEGFTNWTTSWIENSPTETQNSTRALASTIGSSGTLNYSWKTYLITAGSLVLTLPLSLSVGKIVRAIYKATVYYVTYWRAILLFPALGFVIVSVGGLSFGVGGQVTSGIFNGLLFLFFSLKSWKDPRRSWFWGILAVITAACFIISSFYDLYFPVTLIPWGIYLSLWTRQYLRRRKLERSKVTEGVQTVTEMATIPALNAIRARTGN